jgi:dynein light chain Tctex-type 1
MEEARNEAAVFTNEKIEPLLMAAIDAVLAGKTYAEEDANGWVTAICEDALAALAELAIPFKFIVNCTIMQNTGAGVSSAISEYCDGAVDGACVARWPLEKDKAKTNLLCTVTLFGVALFREG